MSGRDEFGVNVPVLAGLVVLVSLAFGFGAITKYGGAARADAPFQTAALPNLTPEGYLNLSLVYYKEKRFQDAIAAAQQAVRMKPDLAEAWNNLGAAFAELGRWDEAVSAEQNALRLRPDFQLARNNLAWAQSGKARVGGR
jgi:tetratricopeptide (TPR) repeat protein